MLHPDAATLDLDAALEHYRVHGYARLGRTVSNLALAAMQARVDDLMHGRVAYPGMFFQRDSPTGSYDDLRFKRGYEGPSSEYRKIEKIELDPLLRAWIQNPLFEAIARRWMPGAVNLYRAVVFSKSERGGTELPWHQDGGQFWGLDEDPTLQIWTALDDTPLESGCVELIPGTHLAGLRTPYGGTVPPEAVTERGAPSIFLPTQAGESLLIHNHTWHRSGLNRTSHPRRALSFCYMPASTRCRRTKRAPRTFFEAFPDPEQ